MSVAGRGVAYRVKIPLAEDGGLMRVVFEFEEVLRRITKKERAMLDAGAGKAKTGLLIKRQPLRFGPIRQGLPRRFREEHQAEMSRINPFLFVWSVLDNMRHELVLAKTERHGSRRFTPESAPQSVDIEALGCIDVMNRKCQMEQYAAHVQRPFTIGRADPSHQPAAM